MATNKVVYGNDTLIDLTSDTATESDVASGKTFHKADGTQATGTATGGGTAITPSNINPVALTKDNSYTIENNNGYAIQSYTNVNIPSSYYSLSLNQMYGFNIPGYAIKQLFYRQRCMSMLCKPSPKNISIPGDGESKVAFILNADKFVYLRYPEGANTLQLVSEMDDGSESALTLASVPAGYHNTFVIEKVHYINSSQCILIYHWNTSATATSAWNCKLVTMLRTGALYLSSAVSLTTAGSATLDVKAVLIPLLTGGNSWLAISYEETISSGALVIYYNILSANLTTGALAMVNTNRTSIASSNANSLLPPMDRCPSKGGIFYKTNNGNDKVLLLSENGDTVKNIVMSNTYSDEPALLCNKVSGTTAMYVYMLGYSASGYLVTCRINGPSDTTTYINTRISLDFWNLDLRTPYFKYISSVDLPTSYIANMYSNFVSHYKNDAIIFGNYGNIMCVFDDTISGGYESLTLRYQMDTSDSYIIPRSSPMSDLFNCTFLS